MPRTYNYLEPQASHFRCSFVLPNQMQCWRAGDYEVTEEGGSKYQLCERHTHIQQAIDSGALSPEGQTNIPVPSAEPETQAAPEAKPETTEPTAPTT